LYALADAFEDILSSSRRRLSREFNVEGKPPRVTVDDSRAFVGFDGYQKVIDCCDVVLLASTPHFRPEHLRAAVAAGRHIFCEKPIAVDAPGVQSVLQSTEI
ncbi:MAG: Gfo/Idh/MocA family oxidoreductase, partial [Phycisphaerae bacterium]